MASRIERARQRFLWWQRALLCLIRKWWRPFSLVGVGVGTWVNLVIIPLATWQLPNLAEAAAWITALGALSWVREWGKVKGVKDD